MEMIRGRHNLRAHHRGCVATVGSFDGLHRGHQALLQQVAALAKQAGLPSALVTFEPLPREYLLSNPPPRLTRWRDKQRLLAQTAIERVLYLRFNADLAQLPPESFITQILVQGLGVAHLVVGDDFRFGRGGQGDSALLRREGERWGFTVHPQTTVDWQGGRISSTRIREALLAGDFATAEALLGRSYSVSGRVCYGDQLGRTLGFPTANLPLRPPPPLAGVYAVWVAGPWIGWRAGVANVGTRPTVGGRRFQLEVHLFNCAMDLYGSPLTVRFSAKIREEQRFPSLAALKAQLSEDVAQARRLTAVAPKLDNSL